MKKIFIQWNDDDRVELTEMEDGAEFRMVLDEPGSSIEFEHKETKQKFTISIEEVGILIEDDNENNED